MNIEATWFKSYPRNVPKTLDYPLKSLADVLVEHAKEFPDIQHYCLQGNNFALQGLHMANLTNCPLTLLKILVNSEFERVTELPFFYPIFQAPLNYQFLCRNTNRTYRIHFMVYHYNRLFKINFCF